METIRFYRTADPYGEFSNFSRHPIVVGGKEWRTSEHFFQAMKFAKTEPKWAAEIRQVVRPKEAATMGRDRSHQIRSDWENMKDDAMRLALLLKFSAHPKLQELLLRTGDAQIIEATTDDYYWGEGSGKSGKNMLGKILVETRELLRQGNDVVRQRIVALSEQLAPLP